jgi:hypothetical protein
MPTIRHLPSQLGEFAGALLFPTVLILMFTGIPGRIVMHFGMPSDWAFIFTWCVFPIISLSLVIAAVLVSRWFAQDRHSTAQVHQKTL